MSIEAQTLVLDQAYRPHKIIDWRRAVTLLFMGRVEVVESYDSEIRSVSLVLKVPAVVRLLQRIRVRKQVVRFSRINVLVRDKYRCCYCDCLVSFGSATYDHVIPRSRGGKTCFENVVIACRKCNDKKADRMPEQVGMRLLRRPTRPASLPLTVLRVSPGLDAPSQWATYLYWMGQLDDESSSTD